MAFIDEPHFHFGFLRPQKQGFRIRAGTGGLSLLPAQRFGNPSLAMII